MLAQEFQSEIQRLGDEAASYGGDKDRAFAAKWDRISLTPANSYAQKTDSQGAENRPVSGKRGRIQPVSGVNRASAPLTALTPRVRQHPTPILVPPRDPNRGIALRFEPTTKEKFQVDDCGNARRIIGRDES